MMDPEKVAAMKRQEEIRLQMQFAYRSGNIQEANRLQNMLKPDAF